MSLPRFDCTARGTTRLRLHQQRDGAVPSHTGILRGSLVSEVEAAYHRSAHLPVAPSFYAHFYVT
jgi:hypothetical protein